MARRKVTEASAKLTRPAEAYTPIALHQWAERDLRKEYSRLRSIARKRLERFKGTEWTQTAIYKRNKNRYKPLSQIKSRSELERLTADVALFVTAKTSTVSGLKAQRERTVKTMQEHGYTFVSAVNIRDIWEWLEEVRSSGLGQVLDSGEAVYYYAEVGGNERSLTVEKFEKWLEKRAEAIRTRPARGGGMSASEMRRSLDIF